MTLLILGQNVKMSEDTHFDTFRSRPSFVYNILNLFDVFTLVALRQNAKGKYRILNTYVFICIYIGKLPT